MIKKELVVKVIRNLIKI